MMNEDRRTYVQFDQFQRYETFARIINANRGTENRQISILELGANEHKDLQLFLPDEKILFTDIELSESMQKDPDFQQADGTNLPFEDNSFDYVVAADVLEHVDAQQRQAFLSEMVRVARSFAIISFPYDSPSVAEAETRVNSYYKTVTGQDFRWLYEHRENGLPKLTEINEILDQSGLSYINFFHGDVETWEKVWYCQLDTVFELETLDFRTNIDHYYNCNIYANDVSNNCYRAFYIIAKQENTLSEIRQKLKDFWGVPQPDTLMFLDHLLNMRSRLHILYTQDRLHREIQSQSATIQNQNATIQNQNATIESQSRQIKESVERETDLKNQLAAAQYSYDVISNAFFWKLTKPMRDGVDFLYRFPFFLLPVKGLKSIKNDGLRVTERKVRNYFQRRKDTAVLATKELYSKEQLEAQKQEVFPKEIKFSIVVPLYNTPEQFLREMIQSVLDQTYSNWELCMADGSDDKHDYVQRLCKKYALKDNRIKYQKLEKNLGISGNTNACLDMTVGDYIALLDHDDLLHPAALHDVMKAICEQDADFIYTDESSFHKDTKDAFCPHFKPDFAPDSLRGLNYICHMAVFKKNLVGEAGMFRPECDGSQDYDMVLRLTEKAQRIVHIPEILYYWRAHKGSTAESITTKPYVIQAAHKALSDHLERVGLKGKVSDTVVPSVYRIKYEIIGTPLISIMIPNYEHKAELETCLNSIFEKSTYPNFEIVVIENNSKSDEIFAYYDEIQKKWPNVQVVRWQGPFNYSAINNYGASFANGKHLTLLNNDTEVISPDWIQEMLMFSQRSDVGAVGAMLYYPDDTIQHAGVILGIGGVGGHSHKYFKRNDYGYMSRLTYAQNLSAVTAACLMVKKSIWDQLGGLDEDFQVAFNDVDFCMRIRQAGYLNVWTPFAELYHYESKSRGIEDTSVKRKRFESEVWRFQARWAKELAAGDPYYNPNFTLEREDFSLR